MKPRRKNRLVADIDTNSDSEAPRPRQPKAVKFTPAKLRIVAGEFRNSIVHYNGDPATRPMKQKTRESLFSLLGGYLTGTIAIDLFGGTGILGFEAVSRGSSFAVILELSGQTVRSMLENMQRLKLTELVQVQNVDTLRWLRNSDESTANLPDVPWVVFCCPPYKMWDSDGERLCEGLAKMYELSPPGSRFVCETESWYDLAAALPQFEWDVREYSPAKVALLTKPDAPEPAGAPSSQ